MDTKSDKAVDALGDSLEKTLLKEEKEEKDAKVLQLQTSEQEADQDGDKKESLLVTAEKDADKGGEKSTEEKAEDNSSITTLDKETCESFYEEVVMKSFYWDPKLMKSFKDFCEQCSLMPK